MSKKHKATCNPFKCNQEDPACPRMYYSLYPLYRHINKEHLKVDDLVECPSIGGNCGNVKLDWLVGNYELLEDQCKDENFESELHSVLEFYVKANLARKDVIHVLKLNQKLFEERSFINSFSNFNSEYMLIKA